jgi:hypothetical protein
MTTVAKLVTRALRMIQVVDPMQSVKPQDMAGGIESLNAMMARWEADGLALGWSPVSSPSQDVPIPVEAETAVAASLAIELCPEYGTDPSPYLGRMAEEGHNALRRDQAVATPIRAIVAVPVPDSVSVHSGGLVNGGVVG